MEKQDFINTLSAVGVRGLLGVVSVEVVPDFSPENIAKMGQLIIQIVIGVATIVSMFKKSKQPTVQVNAGTDAGKQV